MKNIVKKYWTAVIGIALLIVAVFFIYQKLNKKQLPPNLVMGTGTIDGDLVNINTKYPGRIKKLYVDESDNIKKGQLVAEIEDDEYKQKLKAIEAQIKAKEKELEAKKIQLKMTKKDLNETIKKAKSSIEINKAMLSELEKNIESLKKIIEQDKRDYKRFKNLTEKNLMPKRNFEEIKLKLETDKDKLSALLDKKKQIEENIKIAESNLNQAKNGLKNLKILKKSIEALKNAIDALKAQKGEIEVVLNELLIKAPLNGYIVDKIANEGEVIGAGMPIFTAIDPKELYLKMYVDTIKNGKIKIGDKAEIFLDAYPDKPIPAKVVKVAKKAEFTPKEVAVREDRIQRVYAVRLKPLKPNPLLKLGLPATGVISLDGKKLPKSLNELPEL
ncbi:HlyD family secretion protein [Hydrogenothermus marinus]|uniref:HlyD family secretion protein n=1 Tax=Hydrogenothermus marinus TaxID=133270 RepID=A0A3M0BRQ0_9AQUI|nr:HlyD family secretion protein [Hydrogenothermus marinus]RMA97175.1 HlyD family secretion protein [Hydrogenothermus marinus]